MPKRKPKGEKRKTKIDKAWFIGLLKDRDISMRAFARMIRLDQSSVSRMLNGERDMSRLEAKDIAETLGVPLLEVLRHSGITSSERLVPIIGHVDYAAAIHYHTKPDEGAPAPAEFPGDGVAFVFRTPNGPLSYLHGGVLFTTAPRAVTRQTVNRICVARLASGETLLRYVARTAAGDTLIYHPFVPERGEAADIESLAPVLWIRV